MESFHLKYHLAGRMEEGGENGGRVPRKKGREDLPKDDNVI